MNFQKIKEQIKKNRMIAAIYAKLIGNKKVMRIEAGKKDALQRIGFIMLNELDQALTKRGAKYFLSSGSLLGVVRDGAFMKHDDDLDVCIYIDESFTWDDLEDIMKKIGMKKTRQFTYDGKIHEQTYAKDKLLIDFFGCWEDEDYLNIYVFFRKKDYDYSSSSQSHVSRLMLYKPDGLDKITINNATFNIPRDADKFLESLYTSNWRVPDPNWSMFDIPAWHELEGEIAHGEYFK